MTWRRALSRYNSSKQPKPNYNKATLTKYLYEDPLGTDGDLSILKKMIETDYGVAVNLSTTFKNKLKDKMNAYIDSILNNDDDWR